MSNDIEIAKNIIKAGTKAGPDILNALDGTAAPQVLGPEEAKALGFVTEICDLGDVGGDGMPVVVWTA